ncbi:hypothetical protein AUEXF2481DRAFT_6750 [Aureobasidium subglaciale EXF-2481]|uniref:Uncharacterized protein n=1 Tax=Aureobasidium subglaciale (strain EXF-2481) TaxID=1043005 RepID=A0A074Y7M7_AURSE|nr:uncharacterized protein AUEXF2481DRAFT_6750 [Aureobasidium subglaciale EXF-2481]KAI5212839.1 hypothetical protein E4T38_00010 [Aureobasidium subglaciale]KAI5232477.1 hypothetical protein E4T40_00010 [Aureobasidium subglaciale]KAI5234647.1 hypothetical protein E4T41_00010 [Aureobasidium subglaciale]KAI5268264.1 hypothetical protein E4T46_00010 [Aureobasidium subglaciale]KEQ93685.1 hypothetical protein AUEXF2481DRAFT_6750 [Aureobasidium subglaciale EXF-2481]
MSTDFGRKDLSDKVELSDIHCPRAALTKVKVAEAVTPQSAKGPLDVSKEHATGHADRVARDIKPDDHKSVSQSVHDKASRLTSSDNATDAKSTTDHKSVTDKIKDAVPGLHSDKRSDAAEVLDPNTSTTASDVVNKNL